MAKRTSTELLYPEDSSEYLGTETEGTEDASMGVEDAETFETAVLDYQEDVLGYLDCINSGVVCSIVLLGAILGTLVLRVFLDKVSE